MAWEHLAVCMLISLWRFPLCRQPGFRFVEVIRRQCPCLLADAVPMSLYDLAESLPGNGNRLSAKWFVPTCNAGSGKKRSYRLFNSMVVSAVFNPLERAVIVSLPASRLLFTTAMARPFHTLRVGEV